MYSRHFDVSNEVSHVCVVCREPSEPCEVRFFTSARIFRVRVSRVSDRVRVRWELDFSLPRPSLELMLPGTIAPRNFCTLELSLLVPSKRIQDGAKVHSRERNILDCQSILTRRLIFVVVITGRYHITVD